MRPDTGTVRCSRMRARLALLLLLSLGACAAGRGSHGVALTGTPTSFPAQNPALTLLLPTGWRSELGAQGNLLGQPASGADIHLALFALPAAISSDQIAQSSIDGFAHRYAASIGITDLVQNHAARPIKANEATTMVATDYAGRLQTGEPAGYSLGFFRANGRYFGLVIYGSAAADKATEPDQALIVQSLAPRHP